MKESEETPWTCTDPDNMQYGRRLSTYKFEFKEFDRDTYPKEFKAVKENRIKPSDIYFTGTVIDLEKYSMKEIMNYTESYYENLDEIAAHYNKDFSWIVAECIFEQQSRLY